MAKDQWRAEVPQQPHRQAWPSPHRESARQEGAPPRRGEAEQVRRDRAERRPALALTAARPPPPIYAKGAHRRLPSAKPFLLNSSAVRDEQHAADQGQRARAATTHACGQ